MAEELVLKAKRRQQTGTRIARRERKEGLVPAIIYGHGAEPLAILLNYHDLALELQHRHRLLAVELEGKQEKHLVKAVQYDYLGDTIIHVDLTRVAMDERVQITVAVELKGVPAGASEGGMLDQMLGDVELECLVTSIPESIKVPVAHMHLGDALLASELPLPDGAKLITDPEARVAMVRAHIAQEEVEEEEVAEVAESGEPEVIAREKEEGAESEERKK